MCLDTAVQQWLKWVRSSVRSCSCSCSLFECIYPLELLYNTTTTTTTTTIYVTLYAQPQTHTHTQTKKRSLQPTATCTAQLEFHQTLAYTFTCTYAYSYLVSMVPQRLLPFSLQHLEKSQQCALCLPCNRKLRFNECSIYTRPASSMSFSFGVNVSCVYLCVALCALLCTKHSFFITRCILESRRI